MSTSVFIITLAVLTLVAFGLGGYAERRRVRRAWERGDRTFLGQREEERRASLQPAQHEYRR
jgi:hypothetical protein